MSKVSFTEAIKQAIQACKDYVDKKVVELKKSVSDGKTLVATAITDKGVATEPTDSFATMAENVGKISTGSTGVSLTQVIGTTTTTSNCNQIKSTATNASYTE